MVALTAKNVTQLNNMNAAAQRAQLGSILVGNSGLSDGTLTPVSLVKYSSTPDAASVDSIHLDIPLTDAGQTITTDIIQPRFPLVVTATGGDSNVSGDCVIVGTNFANDEITDTLAMSGTSTIVGSLAFKTISSITVPPFDTADTETISIGNSAIVGFPVAIPDSSLVLYEYLDGSSDGGTVDASSLVEESLYEINGSPDGIKVLELVYYSLGL